MLKEREDIIKKLGLTLQDLKCYETYEPFFYYENKEFSKGKILIIENKDTFWTIQNVVKTTKYKNIYLVIYGEGKKIYEQLKSKYSQYNIKAYKTGYQKILDIEKNPNKIRANQICNLKNNEEFLKEFDKDYQKKLQYIFENKLYIPQEVFNASIAEKIMKGE